MLQEREQRREQLCGLFNVRHVAAIFQHQEVRAKSPGNRFGRREGNGILSAMNDECWQVEVTEGGHEVEVAQGAPDGLLHATREAKRREVAGAMWIGEVAGDAHLEQPLPVCVGVTFPEA